MSAESQSGGLPATIDTNALQPSRPASTRIRRNKKPAAVARAGSIVAVILARQDSKIAAQMAARATAERARRFTPPPYQLDRQGAFTRGNRLSVRRSWNRPPRQRISWTL
jgi:hypothetical protein